MGGMTPVPAGPVAFYSMSVMIGGGKECGNAYAKDISQRRGTVAQRRAVRLARTRTRDGDLGEAGDGRSLGDGGSRCELAGR